jgi:hypothetical protein
MRSLAVDREALNSLKTIHTFAFNTLFLFIFLPAHLPWSMSPLMEGAGTNIQQQQPPQQGS